MMLQPLNITEVVRWNEYRADTFGNPPNPTCPICEESLGHSVTLIVSDAEDNEHEIHANCYSRKENAK